MHMEKHNQDGSINVLLVPLILAGLLLVGALSFGVWAFGERQNYKDNVDQIVTKAVAAGKTAEGVKKDAEYAELAKNPLKTYKGPEAYGSVSVQYPKTWSSYSASGASDTPNVYFHPDVVPSDSPYALRLEVINRPYAAVVKTFSDKKDVTVSAFSLAKLPSVVGVKVDGEIDNDITGSMVILPMRDKTLEIYTESTQYLNDFTTNVLPNTTFVP
jgi:hypothetical protein